MRRLKLIDYSEHLDLTELFPVTSLYELKYFKRVVMHSWVSGNQGDILTPIHSFLAFPVIRLRLFQLNVRRAISLALKTETNILYVTRRKMQMYEFAVYL